MAQPSKDALFDYKDPDTLLSGLDRQAHSRIIKTLNNSPWVLRITEYKKKPVPVMLLNQRQNIEEKLDQKTQTKTTTILRQRGLLYGDSQRRCIPILRTIVRQVQDEFGIPLELDQFLKGQRILFRGNLPLDEEAGAKLALIFKLQERIRQMDRVELIARRVERFTKEEANYWFSRMTYFEDAANRWAAAGMKIMLGGHSGDKAVLTMLNKLKEEF